MRSLLLSQTAERGLSDERLGMVVDTPLFRVLYKAMNAQGPRFWFWAVGVLRVLLFVILSWVTALEERDRVQDVGAPKAAVLIGTALVNHRDPQG